LIYLTINNIVALFFIFFAFVFGLINGQKLQNGEKIHIIPDKYEKELEKENRKEQEVLKAIQQNIDSYDGTPESQRDLPEI